MLLDYSMRLKRRLGRVASLLVSAYGTESGEFSRFPFSQLEYPMTWKRNLSASLVMLALFGVPVSLVGQDPDRAMMMTELDSAGVATAVHAFHAALKSGDEAAVRALLLPTARIIEGSNIETADQYLSGHMRGDMSFAAGLTREILTMEIFQSHDIAWATSRSHSSGESRGRTIDSNGAEMMVLQKVEGVWRIAAIQWS